jgi:hypothetical protein
MNVVGNRPVSLSVPTGKPVKREAVGGASDIGPSRSVLYTYQPGLNTFAAAGQSAVVGGRFTPPLIVDLFKNSFLSAFSLTNVAWFGIPSAIRNVRSAIQQKISGARAGANVVTETTLGIGKAIVAGTMVAASSIATAPLLGRLPLGPRALPLVSIAISLVTNMGTFRVLNRAIAKSSLDRKMSDSLTRLFGGDRRPSPTPASTKGSNPRPLTAARTPDAEAVPASKSLDLSQLSSLKLK